MTSTIRKAAACTALCVAMAAPAAFAAEAEPIHQHPGHPIAADTSGSKDPYKDCTPNAEKAAQMKEHPMPDTKGMKNMDPKLHEIDCPQTPSTDAKPIHEHKVPGTSGS